MIRPVHLFASAAALAAALLFGCRSISSGSSRSQSAQSQIVAAPPPPRVTLDTSPGIAPPDHPVAGWIEWVSADGRNVVIELAGATDPATGRIWWVRDEELKPVAVLAIQPPRSGLRVGAIVTRGDARVGAEVVSDEPARAPRFPPLQAKPSK